jgi:hypothetical protein
VAVAILDIDGDGPWDVFVSVAQLREELDPTQLRWASSPLDREPACRSRELAGR